MASPLGKTPAPALALTALGVALEIYAPVLTSSGSPPSGLASACVGLLVMKAGAEFLPGGTFGGEAAEPISEDAAAPTAPAPAADALPLGTPAPALALTALGVALEIYAPVLTSSGSPPSGLASACVGLLVMKAGAEFLPGGTFGGEAAEPIVEELPEPVAAPIEPIVAATPIPRASDPIPPAVQSWYDAGKRLIAPAPAVQSWYDAGKRLR